MRFIKYQALGNDYLVIPPPQIETPNRPTLTPTQIQRICDRHYGIGSDGILWGPLPDDSSQCDRSQCDRSQCDSLQCNSPQFKLRMFNPDGSEFEKSGNGLRIFARYLWDQGLVTSEPFTILSLGGLVTARVQKDGQCVTIDMGQINFDSTQIPVEGPPRQVLNEKMTVQGQQFRYCAATIGNPHCVILSEQESEVSKEWATRWGPLLETADRFPNRTNVQFMHVLDRNTIKIEIWERGAGYTLASGSSSSAAASVAHRLGFCDREVSVHCPGGQIDISIGTDWSVRMTGSVGKICEGILSDELFISETI